MFLTLSPLGYFHLSLGLFFCLSLIKLSLFSHNIQIILRKNLSILLIFLCLFSLIGYVLQGGYFFYTGQWLKQSLSLTITAGLAGSLTFCIARQMFRLSSKNHISSAFLGKIAVMSSEKANVGRFSIATYRDEDGRLHELDVEPESGEILQGEMVLIFMPKKHGYIVRKVMEERPILIK